MTPQKLSTAIVFVALLLTNAAQAQMVDYNSLETLFGEPVTTSATGKPQKSSDVPVGLDIITGDQIKRMGVTSLPEILAHLPGITAWQGTRGSADVGIRGQNAPYNPTLLVLVNGRQVYIDSYGFTDWSLIPVQMEEIRQIEVVKGPATALYGFNAVNGVINIITLNPQYDQTSEVGLVGGTSNYGRAYGYNTFEFSNKTHIRFSGSTDRFDEFSKHSKTNFSSTGSFSDIEEHKLAADGIAQLSDATQLRLETSYSASQGTDVPGQYVGLDSDKTLLSAKAGITSETSIGQVQANLYTNVYHSDLGGTEPGKIANQITVAQLQDLFKVNTEHTFRLQGEYRHNSLQSQRFLGSDAELAYDVAAVGGMWNWTLSPSVEWTNALRLDHLMLSRDGPFNSTQPYLSNNVFDQSLTDYSLNSGIVWKATNKDSLRASIGRGIQAPSLLSLGLDSALSGTSAFVGSPILSPTVVMNYEMGYDRRLASIGGKWRSSLFYRTTDDIVSFGTTNYTVGGVSVSQADSIGSSNTAGFELGLNGTIGQAWVWDADYLYQTTHDNFRPGLGGAIPIHYADTVPHHTLKFHGGYNRGPWQTDFYGELNSAFDAVQSGPGGYSMVGLDGYVSLGGRVAYQFDHDITLALLGSDLSRARTPESYGLEAERRVFLSLSKKF